MCMQAYVHAQALMYVKANVCVQACVHAHAHVYVKTNMRVQAHIHVKTHRLLFACCMGFDMCLQALVKKH